MSTPVYPSFTIKGVYIQGRYLDAYLIPGFLIDWYGRRLTIIMNSVVFLVGALILGLTPNFPVLVSTVRQLTLRKHAHAIYIFFSLLVKVQSFMQDLRLKVRGWGGGGGGGLGPYQPGVYVPLKALFLVFIA